MPPDLLAVNITTSAALAAHVSQASIELGDSLRSTFLIIFIPIFLHYSWWAYILDWSEWTVCKIQISRFNSIIMFSILDGFHLMKHYHFYFDRTVRFNFYRGLRRFIILDHRMS